MEKDVVEGVISIDHFLYGSEQGYKIKAYSSGVDVETHTKPFSGCFIPIKQADVKNISDARVILPAGMNYLLLSRIIQGDRDEYNRKTIANHTAMIPRKLLAESKLSYEDVNKAMINFESDHEQFKGKGDMNKLDVISEKSGPELMDLKKFFIREDVERLMKYYKDDKENKVFILYKNSTAEQRIHASYLLSMLIDIGLNIVPLAIFSDVIYPDAKRAFNLILARSMISVKPGQGWVMLPVKNLPVQAGLLRTGKDPLDEIYK